MKLPGWLLTPATARPLPEVLELRNRLIEERARRLLAEARLKAALADLAELRKEA